MTGARWLVAGGYGTCAIASVAGAIESDATAAVVLCALMAIAWSGLAVLAWRRFK